MASFSKSKIGSGFAVSKCCIINRLVSPIAPRSERSSEHLWFWCFGSFCQFLGTLELEASAVEWATANHQWFNGNHYILRTIIVKTLDSVKNCIFVAIVTGKEVAPAKLEKTATSGFQKWANDRSRP